MIDRGGESRSSVVRPPSIHGTLTRHHALATLKRPTSISSSNTNDEILAREQPSLVYLEMKKAHSLGISLVGGNAVGIFVHAVQTDSPAYKVYIFIFKCIKERHQFNFSHSQAGLRCGDRLLEFNGSNLREATAEQAAYELAKATDKITVVIQHDMERYREIAEQPGDSFYVRALFDKMPMDGPEELELCFKKDDILYVDNTMFNGVPGKRGSFKL